MILGRITPSEEGTVTATTQPTILVPATSLFAPTAMRMSSDITEIGSLVYQDPMEYVNIQEQQETNCLKNGFDAVEINIANTPPAQQAINSASGTQSEEDIFNQILSNTSKHCSQQKLKPEILAELQQQQHHHLSVDYHNNSIATHNSVQPQQITASTSSSQQEQFQAKDESTVFTLSPNLSSPTMMYFDDFNAFLSDYDLCEEKDSKLQCNLQNEERTLWENYNGANDALDNGMDLEETFEITHENEGMVLTSTQELIVAEGISTEDFNAFQNTIIDNDGDIFEGKFSDGLDEPDMISSNNKIKLEADPMLSVDILGTGKNTPSPKSIDYNYGSPQKFEIGGKAAQQLRDLIEYAESGPRKDVKTSTSGFAIRKNKGQNLNLNISKNSTSEKVDLTTADVVHAVFTWENANTTDELVQSPLDSVVSLPPSSSNSMHESTSAFLYDEVTQSSQLSDSRFDFAGFASTAPPTPFSTASYETASNTERKRRGRPPKTHSTQPDPEVLKSMSPSQRKYFLQRQKNNEASRQSRRNRKNKQDQQKQEEAIQRFKNDSLQRQVAKWEQRERLLKDMLQQLVVGVSN